MTQDIRTIRIATQGPAGPAGLYPQASWDAGKVPYVCSTVLAHNGGVWLALRDTSVEPSSGVPDDWASWLDFSGMTGSFATLGSDGKLTAGQLPALAITDTFTAASQSAMLALAAEQGDICIRSDVNETFILSGSDPTQLASWTELLFPGAVTSVAGRTGAVTLAQADISGLTTASSPTFTALTLGAGSAITSSGPGGALASGAFAAAYSLPTASTGVLGGVKVDGTTITISGGVISSSGAVTSVAGRTGAVTLAQADISGLKTSDSPTFYVVTATIMSALVYQFADASFYASEGSGVIGLGSNRMLGWSSATNASSGWDVLLQRDAAATLALRNGTSAQAMRFANTFTSATNFSSLTLDAGKTTSGVLRLMAEVGASGTKLPIAIDGYSMSGAPTSTQLPAGTAGVFKDSSGGGVVLAYNDGGTIKSVALS